VFAKITRTWPFLVQRAREAGVPWPRAFIAGGFGLVFALLALLVLARRVDKPKPPAPEIADDLQHAESLLARGELEPARASLQQLLAAHPDSARVHYLYGNLDYASGERERALGDYRDAIRLDGGYRSDPTLRANLRALLERRAEGPQAVDLLADIGKPALPDLVTCAKTCRDERVKKRAIDAAIKIGGPQLLAEEGKPAAETPKDDVLDKLENGRNCRERKSAALALIATGDPKYLDALVEARDRRGGFFGVQKVNGCMKRELDAAIKKWEAQK
jgi:tetratricopeptide (TPR) repeat protein